MMNRRESRRYATSGEVRVSTMERSGSAMLRDVSLGGALISGRRGFVIGERLTLRFGYGVTTGEVVRASLDANDDTLFQHLTAVRFDAKLTALPS
jgi:hypothetical protein